MEEIDLIELLNYFKKKIGLIIIIMSAVGILGCIYTLFIQKPMYNSYTTVILSGSSSSSITQTDVTLNKNLISTYAEIVKSGRVLNQVIKELNLDISYELLSSEISVTSLNNTEIIKITVNNESPDMAMKIANSTASAFTKEVSSLYKMDNVSILDYATINESPYNINILKQLIIYILAGLVISLGTVFMIFYFDRTIKSAEQIEQKIKLPVLGSVQDISKGGKK